MGTHFQCRRASSHCVSAPSSFLCHQHGYLIPWQQDGRSTRSQRHSTAFLLASSLPWGPPAYALGVGHSDDPKQPDQSTSFFALARCVDGAYERHGEGMKEAWDWARPFIESVKAGGSCAEYTAQDLLDLTFLHARGERFSDGLVRSAEPILREMVREVVKRVRSSTPPVFLG